MRGMSTPLTDRLVALASDRIVGIDAASAMVDAAGEIERLLAQVKAQCARLADVEPRLVAALVACGNVAKIEAHACAETARAERSSERLYRVIDPALAAMQRADDAMTYGLAECERLRAVVALAVEALDLADYMSHPDLANRYHNAAEAARKAFDDAAAALARPPAA